MADQGVVNINVDAPAIDQTSDDLDFSGYWICQQYDIANTEHLANLDKVAGKRFIYFSLPLKIHGGMGSPIRAVAFVEKTDLLSLSPDPHSPAATPAVFWLYRPASLHPKLRKAPLSASDTERSFVMKKFFNISLAIGITAGAWAFLTNMLGLIPWPAFIGWSIFFWEGANMKAVVRSFPNILLGAVLGAVTLFVQVHWATSALTGALAICVLAFTMTFAQNLKPFCVPCAIFVGCSHYYALSSVDLVNGFSFTAFWHAAGITSCGLILGIISMALTRSLDQVLIWKD